VRSARAAIKAELKTGTITLTEVIDRADDPVVGKMKVTALLASLPGIGKVRTAQLMAELDIAPTRRVAGLGTRQRAALLDRFAA
jgi:ribosomal protein S13